MIEAPWCGFLEPPRLTRSTRPLSPQPVLPHATPRNRIGHSGRFADSSLPIGRTAVAPRAHVRLRIDFELAMGVQPNDSPASDSDVDIMEYSSATRATARSRVGDIAGFNPERESHLDHLSKECPLLRDAARPAKLQSSQGKPDKGKGRRGFHHGVQAARIPDRGLETPGVDPELARRARDAPLSTKPEGCRWPSRTQVAQSGTSTRDERWPKPPPQKSNRW